ncbi:MAG: FG-GAP repeat protein, partial [Chloroflexi bacterium]|nr:FG-GAP repeat protein [Chloroflexota bacterium]
NQGGNNNWGQVRKLTASDGTANDQFGRSVAIHNNRAVVGAIGDDAGSA